MEGDSLQERLIMLALVCAIRLTLFFIDAAQAVLRPFGYKMVDWRSSYKSICTSCDQWLKTRRSRGDTDDSDDCADPKLPRWLDDWRVHMAATDCQSIPASGRWLALSILRQSAEGRLEILRQLDENPDILKVPIIAPVFIISPPRTGTTLLHRLLALDNHNRTFCAWELVQLPNLHQSERAKVKLKAIRLARAILKALPADFKSMHYSDPVEPEECTAGLLQRCGMESTLHVAVESSMSLLKDWKQNLVQSKELQVQFYQFYKKQLQLAVYRDPQYQANKSAAARLVLKCPTHCNFLPGLLEVFPDARLINIIRSPESSVPSLASLYTAVTKMYMCTVDKKLCGERALQTVVTMTQCLAKVRKTSPGHVIDIRYKQLMSSPVEVIGQLYRQLGFSDNLHSTFESSIEEYLRANPSGKHGTHRYVAEEFDLTKERIRTQLDAYYRDYKLI